ncbi:MAG: hypothetical protein M3155_09155 [Actinomycetota bacterium]|nr:hypothetical protein [Candidatus Dormibacteraeota bacterium]MDQ6915961.1 hypothetical protein [Actinomycetota bacterium]
MEDVDGGDASQRGFFEVFVRAVRDAEAAGAEPEGGDVELEYQRVSRQPAHTSNLAGASVAAAAARSLNTRAGVAAGRRAGRRGDLGDLDRDVGAGVVRGVVDCVREARELGVDALNA